MSAMPLIVLQKSFCTDDQKFCGLQARLWCKDVRGTSSPHVKLAGDFGNAIEVIRIGDCFPSHVFTRNSRPPTFAFCNTIPLKAEVKQDIGNHACGRTIGTGSS